MLHYFPTNVCLQRATYSFNSEFHKTVEDDVSGATNKSALQTQGHTNQHLEATDQSNIVLTNELYTDPSPFNEEVWSAN